jgi:hypothetical protein
VPSRISLLDGEHFGSVAADSPRKTMLEAHQAIVTVLWQPISKPGIACPTQKDLLSRAGGVKLQP